MSHLANALMQHVNLSILQGEGPVCVARCQACVLHSYQSIQLMFTAMTPISAELL